MDCGGFVVALIVGLSELAETDLVVKAQAGDKKAAAFLIEHFQPLVWSVTKRYKHEDFYEDLNQEGILALYHALGKFTPGRARFGTYSKYWIRYYIQCYQEGEQSHRKMTVAIRDSDQATYTMDEQVEAKILMEVLYEDLDHIDIGLSDRDKRILIMRLKDKLSLKDTAERLGLTRQRAQQLEAEIVQKFRAHFNVE